MEPVEFRKIYERYASDVMRFALYLSGSRAVRGELRVRPALEGAVMLNPDVEAAALKRTRIW